MRSYSKKIKRLLREYMTEAYERELHRELTKLDQSFTDWRTGTISSGELSYRVHQYETGPARELYKQYNHGENDMNVAYALVSGILAEHEVPAELIEAISGPISFYQSMKEQNELKERD
jgi:hypothetical protein